VYTKEIKLSRREQLIMLEIDKDLIDTASSFVDYMQGEYGFSKSSTWYCLNRLKEFGLADFANKLEQGKPLTLTKHGILELEKFENGRNEIVASFSNSFLAKLGSTEIRTYGRGYVKQYTL
jgi:hypothetical protein